MLEDVGIVVVAGGSGNRFGGTNKLLSPLGGRPLFMRCLLNFRQVCPDDQIVLVVNAAHQQEFGAELHRHLPGNHIRVVLGGATRSASVLSGLEALPPSALIAAVHDAARPLASADLLLRCVESCRSYGSGVAGRSVTDTVKRTDGNGKVAETLDRSEIWTVETPQVFPAEELRKAYRRIAATGVEVTDDAGAMELTGWPVQLVESTAPNLKVTYPTDLKLAETLL